MSNISIACSVYDFCWAVRFHKSITVRRGLLFTLSVVLTQTLPASFIMESMVYEVGALMEWLKSLEERDEQCAMLTQYMWKHLQSVISSGREQ
jgi:hypothetical protein